MHLPNSRIRLSAVAVWLALGLTSAGPSWAQSWEALHGPFSGEVVSTLVTSDGTLFAGTDLKGLFYRHPDLPFWSRVESPVFNGTEIRALLEYEGSVVAGTAGNGVFRSPDGGASWQTFKLGLPSPSPIVYDFLVSQDSQLYTATKQKLFRFTKNSK